MLMLNVLEQEQLLLLHYPVQTWTPQTLNQPVSLLLVPNTTTNSVIKSVKEKELRIKCVLLVIVCSPSDSVFSPVLTKILGKTLKSKTLNTSKFSKVNTMLHELEGDKGKENVAKPVV